MATPSRSSQNPAGQSTWSARQPKPAPSPGTASARSHTVTPRPHGNSNTSNRKNHLYAIAATDKTTGTTKVLKFGISGDQLTPGGRRAVPNINRMYSPRADTQVRQLNKLATQNNDHFRRIAGFPARKNDPLVVTSRVIKTIDPVTSGPNSARYLIRQAEKNLVTQYAAKPGRNAPSLNALPKPKPASYYPRK